MKLENINYKYHYEQTEGQLPTKAICNKGLSGNSNILPRSNFGVGGQESSPQSLTAYSLKRYGQGKFAPSPHYTWTFDARARVLQPVPATFPALQNTTCPDLSGCFFAHPDSAIETNEL